MRLSWLIVVVLTNCAAPPPPRDGDTGPYHITNYAPSPLAPNNCGTPYKFRSCVRLFPRRPQVYVEHVDIGPDSIAVHDMPTLMGDRP